MNTPLVVAFGDPRLFPTFKQNEYFASATDLHVFVLKEEAYIGRHAAIGPWLETGSNLVAYDVVWRKQSTTELVIT